jgi:hypothetical protein
VIAAVLHVFKNLLNVHHAKGLIYIIIAVFKTAQLDFIHQL